MIRPTFIQENFRKNGKFKGNSRLVLGTSGLGGVWGSVDEQESIEMILYALEQGVESIDTSPSYYRAQEYVGKALRNWSGKPPFVSTKIGRLQAKKAHEIYLDYSYEGMCKSLKNSLNLLGVEHIDLLFLHEPQLVSVKKMDSILETLHSFRKEGTVGILGIGGNPDEAFWPYVNRKNFEVVSSFLKMDACSLDGFVFDIPKFRAEGLTIYAASSLHMGLLGAKFDTFVKKPPNDEWIHKNHIENAVKIKKIAQDHGMSLTNLSLRYLFSIREADRVVIGPRTMSELKQSLQSYNEGPLDKEIFNQITEVLLKSID